jgi:hypothetical protein
VVTSNGVTVLGGARNSDPDLAGAGAGGSYQTAGANGRVLITAYVTSLSDSLPYTHNGTPSFNTPVQMRASNPGASPSNGTWWYDSTGFNFQQGGAVQPLFRKATDKVYGQVALSVPMLDVTNPVAVGTNDPRLLGMSLNTSAAFYINGLIDGCIDTNNTTATFVVPAGVVQIMVKMWGAGGGGASNSGYGGGGGYTYDLLPVVPGETLTIVVGGAGLYNSGGWRAFGGGGMGQPHAGGGGGRSEISGSFGRVVAGGGGGAGNTNTGGTIMGGAGGGSSGQDGTYSSFPSNVGFGATQYGPGAGGGGGANAGSGSQGGDAVNGGNYLRNGAGGGGYFGGGAGKIAGGSGMHGPGGGGSGHTVTLNATTSAGVGNVPGNYNDPLRSAYDITVGMGGTDAGNGGSGMVYIQFSQTSIATFPGLMQMTLNTTPTDEAQIGRLPNGHLALYEDGAIHELGFTYGPTAPSTPTAGKLWFDTSSNPPGIKTWTGSAWVTPGGGGSGTTPTASTTVSGTVLLSTPPDYPNAPIAVTGSDPRVPQMVAGVPTLNVSETFNQPVTHNSSATFTKSILMGSGSGPGQAGEYGYNGTSFQFNENGTVRGLGISSMSLQGFGDIFVNGVQTLQTGTMLNISTTVDIARTIASNWAFNGTTTHNGTATFNTPAIYGVGSNPLSAGQFGYDGSQFWFYQSGGRVGLAGTGSITGGVTQTAVGDLTINGSQLPQMGNTFVLGVTVDNTRTIATPWTFSNTTTFNGTATYNGPVQMGTASAPQGAGQFGYNGSVFQFNQNGVTTIIPPAAPTATVSVTGLSVLSNTPYNALAPVVITDSDPRLFGTTFNSTTAIFTNTGTGGSINTGNTTVTWKVPANVYNITVKMWGAGGQGGYSSSQTNQGGGGGYTYEALSVIPGESLSIIVGQQGGAVATGQKSFGGGGARKAGTGVGGGGGRSEISGSFGRVVAGGGGGGSDGNSYWVGGAGGGSSGTAGSGPTGGGGGTQVSGGTSSCGVGAANTGGDVCRPTGYGGAGGGGWYGGGAGGTDGSGDSAGGGGSGHTVTVNGTMTAGSGQTPGNASDALIAANTYGVIGKGGNGAGGGYGGLVYIQGYGVTQPTLPGVVVNGTATFNGPLTTVNSTTTVLQPITVNNSATFNSTTTLTNVIFAGLETHNGSETHNGAETHNASTTFNNTTSIIAPLFTVNATSTISQPVTVNASETFNSLVLFVGPSTTVNSTATFSQPVTDNASTTFNSTVTHTKPIVMASGTQPVSPTSPNGTFGYDGSMFYFRPAGVNIPLFSNATDTNTGSCILSVTPVSPLNPKVVGDNDPRLLGMTLSGGSVYFTSTGTTQTWTVPAGVSSVSIKEWGAGGGGGSSNYASSGGGGGYTFDVLPVTPGETLTIIVGSGGQAKNAGQSGAFGGGGSANGYNGGQGGGGGRSEVRGQAGTVTAGGGGGGGCTYAAVDQAGAGGGTTGASDAQGSAAGGTQLAGGSGGNPGVQYKGGDSITNASYYVSGSGGGGWYGGGSGGAWSGTGAYSGAGGSGHLYSAITGTTLQGSGTTPANSGDSTRAAYAPNAGNGGTNNGAGQGGLVYIQYYSTSALNMTSPMQFTVNTTPTQNGQVGRRADGTIVIFDNNILKQFNGTFRSYIPSPVIANTTVNTTNGQVLASAGTFSTNSRLSIRVFDSYTNSYSGSATDNATLTVNVSNTGLPSLLTLCTVPVSFTSATPYESSLICNLEGCSRGTSYSQVWTMETVLQDRMGPVRSMFTTNLDDTKVNTFSFLWQWGTASTTNTVTPRNITAIQTPGY